MTQQSFLRLIAITDDVRDGAEGLITRAVQATRGGATCIQLRLKHVSARDLTRLAHDLVQAVPVPVVVNDRADVAIAAGAAGVHLGADDVPVAAVRKFTPTEFIIGASVGCDEEVAGAAGADYVGIGPVFATTSKDDAGPAIGIGEFARLANAAAAPAVAVGGITAANIRQVIDAGAAGVAVMSAVFGAKDPAVAARALAAAIGK